MYVCGYEIEHGASLRKAGKYYDENVIVSRLMLFHILSVMFSTIAAHALHTQYHIRTDVRFLDAVFMPTGRQGDGADPQ